MRAADMVRAPWLLIAGGFHAEGGMDRANLELASYLVSEGHPVLIVANRVDPSLATLADVQEIRRPCGSFLLGEVLIAARGHRTARRLLSRRPGARVVVNGGNCLWPGINWVHFVHREWRPGVDAFPLWLRAKSAAEHALACRREAAAFRQAKLLIANSERTRRDILACGGIDPSRVRVVYLGSDPAWDEVTEAERAHARAALAIPDSRPVALFTGGLGFDHRKGFDTLFRAWRELCGDPGWTAVLLVAGGGRALPYWRAEVAGAGLATRVRLLGFSNQVRMLLAASDLLVSPVRYEAYGLNVQEAICRGVPAMVTSSAGVAERYSDELSEMLLDDPDDAAALACALRRWDERREQWKRQFAALGARLRAYSWRDSARAFVDAALEREEITAAPGVHR